MGLPRLANRLTRAAVTAILVVTAALASGTGAAWGYLSTTGAGTASSSLGTLQPPTNVTVPTESATGTVSVSWAASGGPLAPTGYFVTRITVSTGATTDACGTSRPAPTTALACSDVAVPMGTFTYRVTAVTRSWTAASIASGSIAVT
ncbi:MAG: hypothetical protein H7311_14775, partial [Ramlibacter sp.]|nr:hypothetical protein [Cryobacterium sp.]